MLSSFVPSNFYLRTILGLLFLMSFLLPTRQSSILISIIAICSLPYSFKLGFVNIVKRYKFLLSFFCITLLSFLITDSCSYGGMKKMETYLTFLAVVFISSIFPLDYLKKNYHYIFQILGGLLVLLFIVFIALAISRYNQTANLENFFYFQFSSPLGLHPIYLSLLISIVCVQLIFFIDKNRNVNIVIFVVLNVFIVLLASKAILGIHICVILVLMLKQKSNTLRIGLLLLLMALSISLSQTNFVKSRFLEIMNTKSLSLLANEQVKDWKNVNGFTMRLFIQKNALKEQCKQKKILAGFGAFNSIGILNELNEKHNLAITYPNGVKQGLYNYNMHSQYLQTVLNFGVIGFVFFVLLLYSFFRYKSEFDYVLNISFIMILFAFLFESYLDTFRGIEYFSFIYCLKRQLSND